ncbi:hypothetical protein [Streptomyces fodineus]|uniref:hypothetical protein n=1 Tax=Streptomyces fodineus TaxID=1904616 RepID=UPI000AF00319|nr:hypothetical protein [Streptomyces fodineus]
MTSTPGDTRPFRPADLGTPAQPGRAVVPVPSCGAAEVDGAGQAPTAAAHALGLGA